MTAHNWGNQTWAFCLETPIFVCFFEDTEYVCFSQQREYKQFMLRPHSISRLAWPGVIWFLIKIRKMAASAVSQDRYKPFKQEIANFCVHVCVHSLGTNQHYLKQFFLEQIFSSSIGQRYISHCILGPPPNCFIAYGRDCCFEAGCLFSSILILPPIKHQL